MAKVTDIKLTDNSQEVLQAAKSQILLALESIGQEAEGYAKDDCPQSVDTGRLRNSIAHDVDEGEMAAYIGTNVEYAIYVEYGDYNHKVGKNHFLRDAASSHSEHYKAIMEAAMKS